MATNNPARFFHLELSPSAGPAFPTSRGICYVLNYEQLPYRTEWAAFADVEMVLSSHNAPETSTTKPVYTVPAIMDATNSGEAPRIIADSPLIAYYFESTFRVNTTYPNGSRDEQFKHIDASVSNVMRRMVPMVLGALPGLMQGRDLDAFVDSRTQMLGQHPSERYVPQKRNTLWVALEDGLDALSYIDENGSGEGEWVFGGDVPAYADFVLSGAFCGCLGQDQGAERGKVGAQSSSPQYASAIMRIGTSVRRSTNCRPISSWNTCQTLGR
ncbi:hypothetical protein BV22DRAFT_930847 [Leucogyrophana mollusca]|uniref:Uncharacterized protein n=1 Tax=Leucogyrophana mollusca TaxID=85980 RepID=A0ACB8AYQ5_9AGAM|nr:hypothetical protein BV22DRAFT_930847 [Leucogyrophana mollusca]